MSATGLILAAGESRRMGSPKALLRYQGRTFLGTLISLFAARCSPVVVVLGAAADQIRAGLERHAASQATFVLNPDYRIGQTSSMQCGLRAVPAESDGILFTLADHPAVAATTIDALLALPGSLGRAPHPLIRVPRFEGRRGHPVWFSRAMLAEFLAIPAGAAARDVVYRHVSETEYIDTQDPGVVADIDDPAAYRQLIGAEA